MDFRAFWHHIITNLQTTPHGLEVDLSDANFGLLRIDYKGSRCVAGISTNVGDKEAQVYIRLYGQPWSPRQNYHFIPGNANEDPSALPDGDSVANAVMHAAKVGGKCSPELARGIANWISESIEKLYLLKKNKSSESDEDLKRLKLSADAGNVDDLHRAIEILWGSKIYLDFEESEWLATHAESGNAHAQRILGTYYLELDDKITEGLNLLKQAAEQACPEAAYELSKRYGWHDGECMESADDYIHYHYDSPERSKQQHWYWLYRAAELGHPSARISFAFKNLYGYTVPQDEYRRDISYCLAELRELATLGYASAIEALEDLKHLDDDERFGWAAHGAGMGLVNSQVLLASYLRSGKGAKCDTLLAIKWLSHAYISSEKPDILLKLASAHFDSSDMETIGLFESFDALKRYEARYPTNKYASYWGDYGSLRWVRFKVKMQNGHLLVQVGVGSAHLYILDTGSATSPTLRELDPRFPGIKEHIHKTVGPEIEGIFGNDQIMSGAGFVLDMREGNTGTLWIIDPPSFPGHFAYVPPTPPDRLPALSIRTSKNFFADSLKYDDTNLVAYLDTGAQHSYLNHPITEGPRFSDFTALGGFFEKFTSHFQSMDVKTSRISRTCAFGNLPEHLAPLVFKQLRVDAIIGNEFLQGAILCWRKRDNLLHIQDGIHADLIEQFIGTDLNAPPEPIPSRFESYLLGLGDYGPESFIEDIVSVVPRDKQHLAPDGTTSFDLNIIYFDEGSRAGHLSGSRRTLFIVACYFKVLIDQVFHHHFKAHHAKYESLGDTVKLALFAPNINPGCLLNGTVRHDPAADAAFVQARTFFESHLKAQVRTHFPELDAAHVWKTVEDYLPAHYPYLTQPPE
jgi:TPR repeat protein